MPPDSSSNRWLAEQWLLESGVVPDAAIDTLLLYAYSQRGVEKATLEIDRDEAGDGKNPSVKYKIKLESRASLKWAALQTLDKIKNPILKKAALLALIKIGSPIGIDTAIVASAKEYLPPAYRVEVAIVE